MLKRPKPLVLLILDGFGHREEQDHNAIAAAKTPCWDNLQQNNPKTLLDCSGSLVGLPEGQMGNSEVGHIHIGSGRFVFQDLPKINNAVEDGSFFENEVLCTAVDKALENDKALHILGLLSVGGVHSHEEHIAAMIELAVKRGLKKVYFHAFLDGRDVAPKSAASSIEFIEAKCKELGAGQIVSITGRFYAMDRDTRWERVQPAYNLIAKGESTFTAKTALEGLEAAYQRDETDEFVQATAILGNEAAAIALDADDSVVFMNFRSDRAREISRALTDSDFDGFERGSEPHTGYFATLTKYHEDFNYPIAYPPKDIHNGLGETLAKAGRTQLRLAETEKYAHVTFFLNGGRDEPFEGETRILVPSPQVKTYDMQPEMNAPEATDHLVNALKSGEHDVIICNYANCDMVGHTGVWDAAVTAVETIDTCLARIVEALKEAEGQMLITADHGNIEYMVNEETEQVHTAHTTNRVPLLYIGGEQGLKDEGSLSDLAPTMLAILGVEQPKEMTSHSLLTA
ncbi:MAG: 2,3-bisphosphoglycerate-independent phosphoglycerate mutase [Methylococcaceae bacterium]|nr:2,3-bisphosphoglycerate-independent phosphoglycerate mutase [Methylococcaceae bacterium]